MQDIRGAKRMERDLVSRDQLQRCVVCQRYFIKRRDDICSVACLEKAKAAPAGP